MIKSVDPRDSRAVRNLENVIAWNDMMINQKRPKEAIEKYTRLDYIQHNPLLVDGPQGIINYFTKVTTEHKNARLVYHRTIAAGDYVYTHGVFYNFGKAAASRSPSRPAASASPAPKCTSTKLSMAAWPSTTATPAWTTPPSRGVTDLCCR